MNFLFLALIKLFKEDQSPIVRCKAADAISLSQDKKITEEIETIFYILETEIDLRIESIITDLHKYRDEFRKELAELKSKFTK